MSIRDDARREAERWWPHTGEIHAGSRRSVARLRFVQGAIWAPEQADRERAKVPASVAPAAEENALVEIVAEWLTGYMPTPYVPFSDRIGLARTILAAGFRKADREPSDAEVEAAARGAYDRAFLKHAPEDVDRWDDLVVDNDEAAESWREVARAALLAAQEVRR